MSNIMAPLDLLPGEILLTILTQLPDLASLDSAMRASPLFYCLFDTYPVKVFEAVLNCGGMRLSSYTTTGYTCSHIRVMICTIAHIRSSTFSKHIHNLHELEQRVFGEAMCHRTRPSHNGFAPETIDRNVEAAMLRSILATARRITWLTITCIESYLKRFQMLRLHELADKKFRFLTRAEDPLNPSYVPAWRQRPATREVQDKNNLGDPYWIEEQRIMRVFWRLQLIRDLQAAAVASKLHGWPANDVQALRNGIDPLPVYNFHRYLKRAGPMEDNTDERAPEREEMFSVIEYVVQRFYTNAHPPQQQKHWWPPASSLRSVEVSRKWPIPAPRKNDEQKIVKRALIISVLDHASYPSWEPRADYSPLIGNRFMWFRPYGVALWAHERLAAFGLGGLDDAFRHRSLRTVGPKYITWFSILTPGQQQDIESECERRSII